MYRRINPIHRTLTDIFILVFHRKEWKLRTAIHISRFTQLILFLIELTWVDERRVASQFRIKKNNNHDGDDDESQSIGWNLVNVAHNAQWMTFDNAFQSNDNQHTRPTSPAHQMRRMTRQEILLIRHWIDSRCRPTFVPALHWILNRDYRNRLFAFFLHFYTISKWKSGKETRKGNRTKIFKLNLSYWNRNSNLWWSDRDREADWSQCAHSTVDTLKSEKKLSSFVCILLWAKQNSITDFRWWKNIETFFLVSSSNRNVVLLFWHSALLLLTNKTLQKYLSNSFVVCVCVVLLFILLYFIGNVQLNVVCVRPLLLQLWHSNRRLSFVFRRFNDLPTSKLGVWNVTWVIFESEV